ncbi:MAG: ribonuclease III [Actinomycetia bacterium]|nr:ribonuclease III [Actinomycetes bacterium]
MPVASLEKRLGHRFRSRELLLTALTHTSYANERGIEDYERLEFLGDTVLQLVVTRHLFREYSHLREGQMTRVRAAVVRKETLVEMATAFGVGEALRLGKGEIQSGGRQKPSILADSVEAVIGAVYEDGGWKSAQKLIMKHWEHIIAEQAAVPDARDAKTRLQEVLAPEGQVPEYRRTETGPSHARRFHVEVWISGKPEGRGEGSSRRLSEQRAAADTLHNLYPDRSLSVPRPSPTAPTRVVSPGSPIMRRIRDWGNMRAGEGS